MQRADLLERVRERIVTNIVQQCRCSNHRLLGLTDRRRILRFAKERQRAAREVVRAECVLEARVGGTGIHEVGPAKLPNVSESLKDFGINEPEGKLIDPDVVPDGVAQNLEAHSPFGPRRWRQPFGPAFFVAASTVPNFSKFWRNIAASFFACAS